MEKPVITYTDVEELKQRMVDLQTVKSAVESQCSELLLRNNISKRGLVRIIEAVNSFPNPPKRKLSDTDEAAVFRLQMELKELQLTMLIIATELSKHEEKPNE